MIQELQVPDLCLGTIPTYWFLNLRPPASRQTLAVCGGYERVAEGYEVSRAGFPFLTVEFVEEGRGAVDLMGRSFPLHPGRGLRLWPGHRAPASGATPPPRSRKHYFVDFVGTRAERLLRSGPLGDARAAAMDDPTELSELFDLLLRNGSGGTPQSPSHLRRPWSRSCCTSSARMPLCPTAPATVPRPWPRSDGPSG